LSGVGVEVAVGAAVCAEGDVEIEGIMHRCDYIIPTI
jgi:hypothetical protein